MRKKLRRNSVRFKSFSERENYWKGREGREGRKGGREGRKEGREGGREGGGEERGGRGEGGGYCDSLSKVIFAEYLLEVGFDESKDYTTVHEREGIMDKEGKAGVQITRVALILMGEGGEKEGRRRGEGGEKEGRGRGEGEMSVRGSTTVVLGHSH